MLECAFDVVTPTDHGSLIADAEVIAVVDELVRAIHPTGNI